MTLHRAQILTLIIVVLVQKSSSFSVPQLPVVSRRISGVSLPAQPSKDNDSPRKSKRQRLAQVIQKVPQKPRSFLGVVFASVALWRGPNNQAAHAAQEVTTLEHVAKAEKVEAPEKKDNKAALVGALAVTAGGAGFFIARQNFDKKEEELSQEKAELEKEVQKIGEVRNLLMEETKLLEEIKGEQESLTSNLEEGNVEEKVIAFSDMISLIQSASPDLPPKVKITETDSAAREDHQESNESESKLKTVEVSSVVSEKIKTESVPKPSVEPVVKQQTLVEETVTEEPVIEETVVEEVIIEEPVVSNEPVVAEEPVIEEAVIQEAGVEEPVVSTEPVVAEEPVIEEAVIHAAGVEEPVVSTEPVVAEEPVIEEAVIHEAGVEEPVLSTEPVVAEEPVVEETVVEEPVTSTEAVVALDESTEPEVTLQQEAAFFKKDAEDYKKARSQPKAPDQSTEPEVSLEHEAAFFKKDAEDYKKARRQPKAPDEAKALKEKYAAIDSIEERAYQILVDLGIVEKLP